MSLLGKEKNKIINKKEILFYDAVVLAEYIITKCVKEDMPISNLQLQKILYFIQYNFFKHFEAPAFLNTIEAWQHGPVVPDVYNKFAFMAGNPIIREFDISDEIFEFDVDKALVNKVTESCRKMRPWDLVELTHKEGSPWRQVFKDGQKNEIPLQIIAKYAKDRKEHGK